MYSMHIEKWWFTANLICVGEGGVVDSGKNSSSLAGGEVSNAVN